MTLLLIMLFVQNSSNNNVAASEKEAEEILKMISQMPELASLEKGVLDEKYRLVMAIFKEDLKTKRLAEMRKKIETLHDQQKAGNEVVFSTGSQVKF